RAGYEPAAGLGRRRPRPPRRERRRLRLGAAAGAASPSTTSSATGSGGGGGASTRLTAPGTSEIIPVGLTDSSLMRRSRVTSRGEPGGRLKPRALSVRATLSISTAPLGA